MFEQQANELAAAIKEQFPHVNTQVLPSVDTRNAPRHYFVAVHRRANPAGRTLILHTPFEWTEAQIAYEVLMP